MLVYLVISTSLLKHKIVFCLLGGKKLADTYTDISKISYTFTFPKHGSQTALFYYFMVLFPSVSMDFAQGQC